MSESSIDAKIGPDAISYDHKRVSKPLLPSSIFPPFLASFLMFGSLSQLAVFTVLCFPTSSFTLSLSLWHNILFERQHKKAKKKISRSRKRRNQERNAKSPCVWSKTSTDRMILNPTSIPLLPKPRVRLRCRDIPPPKRNFSISFSLASKTTTTTNQIRTQLDQLHAEADQTRAKGPSLQTLLHLSFLWNVRVSVTLLSFNKLV